MTARMRLLTAMVLACALAALVLFRLSSAAKTPEHAIVARVGPLEIDRATFEAALVRAPGDSAKSADQERREFMDTYLNRQLLVLAAKDAGYFDADPIRDYMIGGFEESLLSGRVRNEDVLSNVHLTPTDVDSFYARQKNLYDISHIVVASPEAAAAVKERLAAGADFAALAEEVSLDEKSRHKGGHLEPFVWGLTNRSFLDEIDQLKPGEIGGPIPSEIGYHVVKMNGRPANPNYKPLEPQRAFITQRATVFAQMDTLAAHTRRLEQQYHFAPGWPALNHLSSMYSNAIAIAVRENPTTPADDQYEISKRSLVFPESLQAHVLAKWDFGQYRVKEQLEMIKDLPGLALADRRNPYNILGDARSLFLRGAEVQEARRRGYDQDPDFKLQVARKREELAVGEYYEKEIMQQATFDSTAERAYYAAHLGQFLYEPQVKLACIQYQTDAAAAAAMEEALRSPHGNPDSVIADHDRRGLIRTRIPSGKWFPEPLYPILYERAAGLEKGAVGRVVDEEGFWTVFIVLDKEPGRQLPFEEVRKTVQQSMQNQRADEILKQRLTELKKKYPIWTDAGYLADGGSD
jgi:parvulin-like peptidyl-prolyl isomerase